MTGKTHQSFGITWGLGTLILLQSWQLYPSNMTPTSLVIFFGLVLLGSIFPDIDEPRSKLGRKIWPLSWLIKLFFKHRGLTHSLLFLGIVSFLSLSMCMLLGVSYFYALGWIAGYASHLVGDSFTKRGITLFYPFLKKNVRFPVTFRTSGFVEVIMSFSFTLINVYLFYRLFLSDYPMIQDFVSRLL